MKKYKVEYISVMGDEKVTFYIVEKDLERTCEALDGCDYFWYEECIEC